MSDTAYVFTFTDSEAATKRLTVNHGNPNASDEDINDFANFYADASGYDEHIVVDKQTTHHNERTIK